MSDFLNAKPTNTNLGKFYNLTRQTIATHKKKNINLYNAMLEYYKKAIIQNAKTKR